MLRELTRYIGLVVVHCSDSLDEDSLFRRSGAGLVMHTSVQEIDDWHAKRGFRRTDAARQRFNPELRAIGYHLVIYRKGVIATGRAFSEVGAHARGFNAHSLGICLVGRSRFTPAQWISLANVIGDLGREFKRRVVPFVADAPSADDEGSVLRLCGHRDLSPDLDHDGTVEPSEWNKNCPNFDVRAWFEAGMTPVPEHVWSAA